MATQQDVEVFLGDFKQKMRIWQIVFLNERQKNSQALATLEITSKYREEVIMNLGFEDYSQGPLPETQFGGSEMWVFGKMVKGIEVYIKVTMGRPGTGVLCISFHPAEYRMAYPLKPTES